MDAVPIVPPLFRGTKNTTLHELQTDDRSRATDTRRRPACFGGGLRLYCAPLAAVEQKKWASRYSFSD
jgi:hypothetical protein